MKLRIPAALAFTLIGCGEPKKPVIDAKVADARVDGSGPCSVVCFADGTDAGVCPDPPQCTTPSGEYGECPPGCFCTAICFPDEPNSGACETNPPRCAGPYRECPSGCTALS